MDLFKSGAAAKVAQHTSYDAKDIKVLEGLEPVRLRPGMYIGGTDISALHHLFSEVMDNAMDEAVAGHASLIRVHLKSHNQVCISDDGRGIPVDPHPKYRKKSALEVILTTLHSGGKFGGKAYSTSGGLHGVGLSVVNALSSELLVTVHRGGHRYTQKYSRGKPVTQLSQEPCTLRDHGTEIEFTPDPQIFDSPQFDAGRLYHLVRSKGYLYRGVTIEWICEEGLATENIPTKQTIRYPGGLRDYVEATTQDLMLVVPQMFYGEAEFQGGLGRMEWAVAWLSHEEGSGRYYCNTIYTPQGGTHETGFKNGLLKGLRSYGALSGNNKINQVIAEDIIASAVVIASVFIEQPIFQGQIKEKLLSAEASKLVDSTIKLHFENWLTASPNIAAQVLDKIVQDSEERLSRKKSKEISRKSPIKSLRLPGKLVDCTQDSKAGSEIFLVEGESAGGSAKQARNRENQAILALKGKILNVASSSREKIMANTEVRDLITALGAGIGKEYSSEDLRYDKVIIMTDADVDGAHITSLLLTFFYTQMPKLIYDGHLYLAQPPLYRIVHRNKTIYAANDDDLHKVKQKLGKAGQSNLEIGRFKGLGEMTAAQLKETTMDPSKRLLLRVQLPQSDDIATRVDELMGRDPAPRFRFIKERSEACAERIADIVDV